MSDERREEARLRYLNISHVKTILAEWPRVEFERHEDDLTGGDFGGKGNRPFVPAEAHADGVVLQLAAAFDAFACAIANHGNLGNPDRASFDGWRRRLVAVAGDLAPVVDAVAADPDFRGLLVYRHLAAHRGVVSERVTGRQREGGWPRDEVFFSLAEWLPAGAPDPPRVRVRPILVRYVMWGRRTIDQLRTAAIDAWDLREDGSVIPPR